MLMPELKGWEALGFEVKKDGAYRKWVPRGAFFETTHTHYPLCSAYDLLRFPQITVTDIVKAMPSLSDVSPRVLQRIEIEGTSVIQICDSPLSPESSASCRQVAILGISEDKKPM